jgi:cell division protein FtsL
VLDNLLYGRGWIALVFVLLAGIVFFNVDLLQMNRDIAKTADSAGAMSRENAKLRTEIARLGSSERIQRVAAEAGLVLPAPGEVRYLRSDPSIDARRAAKRIEDGVAIPPAITPEPVVTEPVVAEPVPVEPVVTEEAPVVAPVEPVPAEEVPVTAEAPVGDPTGQ